MHRRKLAFCLCIALLADVISCLAQSTATAIATVVNGFVISITVTSGGSGYSAAPHVNIVGGGGTGAAAVATLANGVVAQIVVTDAGNGYTNAPAVLISSPQDAVGNFSDGLIGHYTFDGNANDSSGNHFDGVAVGVELTNDRFGLASRAYHFSLPSSHVQVPVDFRNSQTVSVCAWVKFDSTADGQGVVVRNDVGKGLSLTFLQGSLSFYIGGSAGFVGALYPTVPIVGKWYFLVGTYDMTTINVYVDGVLRGSKADDQGILYGANGATWIGNDPSNSGFGFHGTIDDVRVYNRALSKDEVAALYTLESPKTPSLSVVVKTIRVNMFVTPGKPYQLRSSTDMVTWTKVGDPFVSTSTAAFQDFDVLDQRTFYRIDEVP